MAATARAGTATAPATPGRSARSAAAPARSHLRLLSPMAADVRRGPFIVLVLGLVVLGTIGLLMLNTAIAADSFAAQGLAERNTDLAILEEQLNRQIAAGLAPDSLADAARDLGLIPAGQPGFVVIGPDGAATVQGVPTPAGQI